MKVKSLMLAGFGTVAGLLLLVALGSAVGLAMSSALFNDYEGMAEDTNLTARIMGTTMTARMSTKKFLETSDQIQVENFRSDMANLDQLLARADREITSPARRVQLSHIKEQSSTYRDAFENVVSLVRQREQLITEKLNRHGLAAADAIAAVLNAMTKRGSASDVYAAAMVQETLLSLRLSVFKYLSTGQSGALDDARVQLDQLPAQLNSLNKRVRGTEATAAIDQFEASVSVYRRSIDELANIVSSQNNAVFAVLDKVGPAIVQSATEMMGSLQEDQQTLGVSILSTNRSIRWAVIILSLFSISVAIAASLWITARVMQPLGGEPVDMAAMADSLARGKLARVANDDATSGLRASMANMNNKLREIVDEVRNASEVIYTNASQVAVGSSELSSRTEQQAASLEQTASAMEQINTTVNSNADNAGRAKKIAEDARIKAEKGTSVSERTERAMQAISDSSSEIAKIISVIDEIAFQTNLLALNAAVEAARAGEQGRGFAVVADEVRNLASRTAVSAKEISALIQGSIESINEGNQLTKASNDALHEIVAAVSDVAQVITEIAAASGEQRQGIGQITAAVHQMDEVTQQNAAMVEESAAAAAMLEASSQALRNTVAFFEFEEEARDTLRLN